MKSSLDVLFLGSKFPKILRINIRLLPAVYLTSHLQSRADSDVGHDTYSAASRSLSHEILVVAFKPRFRECIQFCMHNPFVKAMDFSIDEKYELPANARSLFSEGRTWTQIYPQLGKNISVLARTFTYSYLLTEKRT